MSHVKGCITADQVAAVNDVSIEEAEKRAHPGMCAVIGLSIDLALWAIVFFVGRAIYLGLTRLLPGTGAPLLMIIAAVVAILLFASAIASVSVALIVRRRISRRSR